MINRIDLAPEMNQTAPIQGNLPTYHSCYLKISDDMKSCTLFKNGSPVHRTMSLDYDNMGRIVSPDLLAGAIVYAMGIDSRFVDTLTGRLLEPINVMAIFKNVPEPDNQHQKEGIEWIDGNIKSNRLVGRLRNSWDWVEVTTCMDAGIDAKGWTSQRVTPYRTSTTLFVQSTKIRTIKLTMQWASNLY